MTAPKQHTIVDYEREQVPLRGCCTRARCACGWGSDSYAAFGDAQRAGEVHVRKAKRQDFDTLIARSSIGAAIADVKTRGIEKHLVDLEREMNRRWRRKKPTALKARK